MSKLRCLRTYFQHSNFSSVNWACYLVFWVFGCEDWPCLFDALELVFLFLLFFAMSQMHAVSTAGYHSSK